MSTKEITDLRKNGNLQEALDAAENEFALNTNKYTVSALFWCLSDISKQLNGEELVAVYQRMKSLFDNHCPTDEFMQKSIRYMECRMLPHYDEIKQAYQTVKSGGDAVGICRKFLEYKEAGELDAQLYDDLGWLIYYALKQTDKNSVYNRKKLLEQYLLLDLVKPSILHSLILKEAIGVEQDTPMQFRIRNFVGMWGLENLRDDDWKRNNTQEGKTFPSLVEKLIGVYTKELKTDRVAPSNDFCELLDKALGKYNDNQYLPYYKAITLIVQGQEERAVEYYKNLIIKSPTKSYLWQQLSALVADIDTKIGLLCKAVNTGDDEAYIGRARLRLASLLIEKNLCANARTEIDIYRRTYESQGWGLKQEFHDVANCIPANVIASDNKLMYEKYSAVADNYIYSALPSVYAVKVGEQQVEDRNKPNKKFMQWILQSDTKRLKLKKPHRYGLDKRTSNGVVFEVKLKDDKIVWIKPIDRVPSIEWMKVVSGTAHLKTAKNTGKPFVIIQDVYVGEELLHGINDGQAISVTATRREDGRWRAVNMSVQF